MHITNLGGKISHAISFNDVVSDTFHQFAPAYHDYTLYVFPTLSSHPPPTLAFSPLSHFR